MDSSRNDLLGELAADAALERSDFLVAAAAQLDSFLDANEARIRELGGLVLIDDDVDYLAIDEDMTFRSRSRYQDEATGKWVTETETIDSAAELVELYNPADIFGAFADATAEQAGPRSEAAAEAAQQEAPVGENPYAEAADEWAAGHEFEEAPETEEDAAERLYDLALAFQERSQQTEANLLEQFETASTALTSVLGELIVVDDDDERLTLRANGSFVAEVVPEEEAAEGRWERLDNPDEIVKFYDPTDIFGDLADALAEAFPDLNEEVPEEGEEGEGIEEGEEEAEETEPEGETAGSEGGEKAEAEGGSEAEEDGDRP
jgi:hypothetical protein